MNARELVSPPAAKDSEVWRPEKITPRHLERLAIVYVRQSTPQQLFRHQESREVQYGLKARAQKWGWPEDRILVIDDDLGRSGTSVEGRPGFQRLVAEVTLDHVGIVLGVEMSRLARSCKDWYQLLEVCAVFGTLIADLDGVYNPAEYNDRLLLGLKGTMSEAELHILKQRMEAGRLSKARRGELIFAVPIGYFRRPSGEVVLEPDEEAREVVRLIFKKFEELGTLNAVLRFLVREGVKIPVRVSSGPEKGELQWHRPNRMTLQNILKNPIYAGAYAYGRRHVDPRRKIPGRPSTGRTVVPPERCQVFLKDRFPAYISWEQYERNRERLRANRALAETIGAPRAGSALLAGLVVCGRCGWRMSVRYQSGTTKHVYVCASQLSSYGADLCQSVSGPALDRFVSELVLKVLEPASLELSLEAARNIERERQELEELWQKRLERARYEAERAARQYHHVEPENRLVARQLEQEWEEKLRREKALIEDHERFLRDQPRPLSPEERRRIEALAADIPALWSSPKTTQADRKEIVRELVDRVVVNVVGQSEKVRVRIHWAGGRETEHEIVRPVARLEQLSYWPELQERIRELAAQGLCAARIAERVNEEGFRPPKRREIFGPRGIQDILARLGLCKPGAKREVREPLGQSEWTLGELARELRMPAVTLYTWIRRNWVKSRRSERGRWILWADARELKRLKEVRARPVGYSMHEWWVGHGEGPSTDNDNGR